MNKFSHTLQEFVLNDSIHLILFFTVLSSFYFFYVTKKEEDAQIHLVKKLLRLKHKKDESTVIDEIIKKTIKDNPNLLEELRIKSKESEKKRTKQNNKLKLQTYLSILTLFIVLTIVNIILRLYYKKDYTANFVKSLVSNIISVIILGLVEYIFFSTVVIHYHRIDEPILIYTLLKEYQEK